MYALRLDLTTSAKDPIHVIFKKKKKKKSRIIMKEIKPNSHDYTLLNDITEE